MKVIAREDKEEKHREKIDRRGWRRKRKTKKRRVNGEKKERQKRKVVSD